MTFKENKVEGNHVVTGLHAGFYCLLTLMFSGSFKCNTLRRYGLSLYHYFIILLSYQSETQYSLHSGLNISYNASCKVVQQPVSGHCNIMSSAVLGKMVHVLLHN